MKANYNNTNDADDGGSNIPPPPQYEIRDIAQDGNEFYVFMSLCLFQCHAKATMIRDVLTTYFCCNMYACSSVGALRDDAMIVDSARRLAWFAEWERAMNELTPESDLNHAGVAFTRMNARPGFRTPIRVACALMHVCYNMTIKLYTYDEREHRILPTRPATWIVENMGDDDDGHGGGGGAAKCVSFLVELTTGQLRLLLGAPGQVILEQVTLSATPPPPSVTSESVKNSCSYVLTGYAPDTRRAFDVAYFLSPEHHKVQAAHNVHVLPIDAHLMPRGMKCSIVYVGKQPLRDHNYTISVFALRGERGRRTAKLINYWQLSFAAPLIDVQTLDELVVIVESRDVREAANVLRMHFGCPTITIPTTTRGGDGNNDEK